MTKKKKIKKYKASMQSFMKFSALKTEIKRIGTKTRIPKL